MGKREQQIANLPPVNPVAQVQILTYKDSLKKLATRKITKEDIQQIINLSAKRVHESGACQMLGIKPQIWFDWKTRNASKYSDMLMRAKETQITAHLQNIERFESIDWRASAHLLKIKDPQRFGDQAVQQPAQVTVDVDVLALVAKVFNGSGKVQQALPQSEVQSEVQSSPEPAQISPDNQSTKLVDGPILEVEVVKR